MTRHLGYITLAVIKGCVKYVTGLAEDATAPRDSDEAVSQALICRRGMGGRGEGGFHCCL